MNWQSSDPSIDTMMSCLGVCMAALASPEVVGNLLPTVEKVDEECDKDSGHHSGEEMECVINPDTQVSLDLFGVFLKSGENQASPSSRSLA